MTQVERLLAVCSTYAESRRLSLSRVSTIVFGDGKIISRLEAGSDLTTRRAEAAMKWLSANWPAGATWPPHVPRPPLSEAERAA